MDKKKKTEEPAKTPKLNKNGTPRAKAVRKAPMDAFVDKVTKYVKNETAAVKRAASLTKTFTGIEATLKAWGKLPGENLSATEVLDIVTGLKESGFVPAKGSTRAPGFSECQLVQLKPDFVVAYQSVYSDVEIGSMVYSFHDDVNKRAMCGTDGRFMAVKESHIEPRGTVHTVPAAA